MLRHARVVALVGVFVTGTGAAADAPTAFTAQAFLRDAGEPVDGAVDILGTLFDAAVDGNQVGAPVQVDNVLAVGGLIVWELDFGPGVFVGEDRFLELAIRNPHDPTDTLPFTTLTTRVRLTPTPEAIHAQNASQANALVAPASLSGNDVKEATLTVENTAGVGAAAIRTTGDVTADGSVSATGLLSGAALDVQGDANVAGHVSAGSATVFGDMNAALGTVTGFDVVAGNNVSIAGRLDVGTDASVGLDLDVGGDALVVNDLDLGNDALVGGNLDVGNDATVGNNLDVASDATVGIDLDVTNDTTIGNNLDVANDAIVGANLDVANDTTIGNDLAVSNNISLGAAAILLEGATGGGFFTGPVSFGPDLTSARVHVDSDGLVVGAGIDFFQVSDLSTEMLMVRDGGSVFHVRPDGTTLVGRDLELNAGLIDAADSRGTSGQFLMTTGFSTEWADLKFQTDVDAGGHALINIGTGGSSFGTEGGLNLEGDLVVGPDPLGITDAFHVDAENGDVTISGDLAAGGAFFPVVFVDSAIARATITGSLDVKADVFGAPTFSINGLDGSFFSAGDASVAGAYHDSSGSPGVAGQVLSSTATGTLWVNKDELPNDVVIAGTLSVNGSSTLGVGGDDTTTVVGGLDVDSGGEGPTHIWSVRPSSASCTTTFNLGTDPLNPRVTMEPVLGEVRILGKLFAGDGPEDISELRGDLLFKPDANQDATVTVEGGPGNLHVQGAYHDTFDSPGSSGQVLSSTGTGTQWIDCDCDGGGGAGGDATFDTLTVNNSAAVQLGLDIGMLGSPVITLNGTTGDIDTTGDISTDGSINSGLGATNFLGASLFAGPVDISADINQIALSAFAFHTGPAVQVFNFDTGLGLDVVGGINTDELTASVKNFKIDHPLDPANQYLVHASVESSEMLNVYSGNAVTDTHGYATVVLPDWFEALNTDFRYQLTVIDELDDDAFVQAKVVQRIAGGTFTIRTSAPNVEVSWQVTGVRHDAFAVANPLMVEQLKPDHERGLYRHPDALGLPDDAGIHHADLLRARAHRVKVSERSNATGHSAASTEPE